MTEPTLNSRLFGIDTALLTRACVVRRFREGEGAQLYDLVRQRQDYLYDHQPQLLAEVGDSPEAAETFLRRGIADWLLQERYDFGVWENESAELVGYVSLGHINWQVPALQLTGVFPAGPEGQELELQILARIIRFCFLQLGVEKISYHLLSDNYAAQRTARKAGFSREGDLRNEFRKGSGTLVDVIRFGLSRETYGE